MFDNYEKRKKLKKNACVCGGGGGKGGLHASWLLEFSAKLWLGNLLTGR